jgi:hypothetical protein
MLSTHHTLTSTRLFAGLSACEFEGSNRVIRCFLHCVAILRNYVIILFTENYIFIKIIPAFNKLHFLYVGLFKYQP